MTPARGAGSATVDGSASQGALQLLSPDQLASARAAAGADVGTGDLARLLLAEARACEPVWALARRTELLLACAALAPGEELALEVRAEQAVDAARANRLDEAETEALAVLERVAAEPQSVVWARATEALGRVQAWRGDRLSAVQAAGTLADAAAAYAALGATEWAGHALFWLGNAVHLQRGELARAEELMRAGLMLLAADSPRRASVLTFLSDVLGATGRWGEFDAALDEAEQLAADHRSRAYVAWSRARGASARRDAGGTVRWCADTERQVGEWFDIVGPTFLADAAVLCERVGEHALADEYLRRARVLDVDDEFVRQAAAELLARRGDPQQALDELRALRQAPWLETRLLWQHALLAAWASLRAGRGDVARLSAQAFELADASGGPAVALTGEPELARALAPAAAAIGCGPAIDILAPRSGLLLRLLGSSGLVQRDRELALPVGLGGALVRLLGLHPHGLDADQLVDALWPDADGDTGRRQLRHTLSRLRARMGLDLVRREGSLLRLADMWVDVVAFRSAADRALRTRETGDFRLALALWGGTPLPADPYAPWAEEPRRDLLRRRLQLLDLAAEADAARGAGIEAVLLLEQAIEADPDDLSRYERAAQLLSSDGRHAAASRLRARAEHRLAEFA